MLNRISNSYANGFALNVSSSTDVTNLFKCLCCVIAQISNSTTTDGTKSNRTTIRNQLSQVRMTRSCLCHTLGWMLFTFSNAKQQYNNLIRYIICVYKMTNADGFGVSPKREDNSKYKDISQCKSERATDVIRQWGWETIVTKWKEIKYTVKMRPIKFSECWKEEQFVQWGEVWTKRKPLRTRHPRQPTIGEDIQRPPNQVRCTMCAGNVKLAPSDVDM